MKQFLRSLLCTLPLLVAACGGDVKQSLGLGKEAPDEFVVVSRPPLTLPPNFELHPPAQAGESSATPSAEVDARKALLGADVGAKPSKEKSADAGSTLTKKESGATANFLSKAGADSATPNIRQQLGGDVKAKEDANAPTLYDRVAGKKKSDTVVDAQKEASRIQENKREGKAVTDGETPTTTPKEKSVLDRIF